VPVSDGVGTTRREILGVALSTAGALLVGCVGGGQSSSKPSPAPSPGPVETKTLRIGAPPVCDAAYFMADRYLRDEGFTDIQFVKGDASQTMAGGAADITSFFPSRLAAEIDAGTPVVALAGLHVGCVGLFAQPGIRDVAGLRGKTIMVRKKDPREFTFAFPVVTLLNAGIDPSHDVNIVEAPSDADMLKLFRDGKTDAFTTAVVQMDALRAEGKFAMLVDYTTDAPWSGHHCCLVTATRSFVEMSPNAARRALRAILRANVEAASDPSRGVRAMVDAGFSNQYDAVLAHDRTLPYASWRTVDPEVGVRFFAERLQQAKVVASSGDQVVRKGTDWSLLRMAKQELPGP